ncbi:hypothetical protein [Streptomyces sp. NPDC090445]|uniref:hypothetical protein n=1 Tax=Streptomyces sp. NPDC090445 TaxID=3365963 RepID=UPI0037F846A3
MAVAEQVDALAELQFLSEDIVREVIAHEGLSGTTRKVGISEGLGILRRKNDVWASFEQWYQGLDEGGRKYMDLMLEAALIGLAESAVDGGDASAYEAEARRILAAEGALDLTDPQMVGPVSTAVTRTIIRRTVAKTCATKWAGC